MKYLIWNIAHGYSEYDCWNQVVGEAADRNSKIIIASDRSFTLVRQGATNRWRPLDSRGNRLRSDIELKLTRGGCNNTDLKQPVYHSFASDFEAIDPTNATVERIGVKQCHLLRARPPQSSSQPYLRHQPYARVNRHHLDDIVLR